MLLGDRLTSRYPRITPDERKASKQQVGPWSFVDTRRNISYRCRYGSYKSTKARPWDSFVTAIHTGIYDGGCNSLVIDGQGENFPVPSPLRALRVLGLPQKDLLCA